MQKVYRNRSSTFPTQCINCGEISPRNYQRCEKCNSWLLNTDEQKKAFTLLVRKLAGDFIDKWHKGEIER